MREPSFEIVKIAAPVVAEVVAVVLFMSMIMIWALVLGGGA
jgi:hypothetical protein